MTSDTWSGRCFASAVTAAWLAIPAGLGITSTAAPTNLVGATSVLCPQLEPLRSRAPRHFFPNMLTGLTTQLTPAGLSYGCVYIVPPRKLIKVPVWRPPTRGRMRGPSWAPDGRSFAVAQNVGGAFYVFRVTRDGRVTLRAPGRDFAFLRDGRLVIRRSHWIFIEETKGRFSRLASEKRLQRAAGFRAGFYGRMSEVQGYGTPGVVIQWWAPAGQAGNVLLLVRPNGRVQRVTPPWRSAGTYMPGPASWSPDGDKLMIPWQRPPRAGTADHVHCLALWSEPRGYRNAFCKNPHFGKIIWAPDGHTALLQNGRVVSAAGRVLTAPRPLGQAFGVRWTSRRQR